MIPPDRQPSEEEELRAVAVERVEACRVLGGMAWLKLTEAEKDNFAAYIHDARKSAEEAERGRCRRAAQEAIERLQEEAKAKEYTDSWKDALDRAEDALEAALRQPATQKGEGGA